MSDFHDYVEHLQEQMNALREQVEALEKQKTTNSEALSNIAQWLKKLDECPSVTNLAWEIASQLETMCGHLDNECDTCREKTQYCVCGKMF